jgi:hypothetical protein
MTDRMTPMVPAEAHHGIGQRISAAARGRPDARCRWTEAIGQLLIAGVTSEIGTDDFEHHYRKGDKPRRTRLDTAYGLSFRGCQSIACMKPFGT